MTMTQNLPRTRPVSPLEGFLLTVARLVKDGRTPAAAAGHLMERMAAERPTLLGKVLAELAARPDVAAQFEGLIA
jgi:hypothetical protein